jgi:hypothetical protein
LDGPGCGVYELKVGISLYKRGQWKLGTPTGPRSAARERERDDHSRWVDPQASVIHPLKSFSNASNQGVVKHFLFRKYLFFKEPYCILNCYSFQLVENLCSTEH